MDRQRADYLLDRHFDAAASAEERAELERLLMEDAEVAALFWQRADFQLALWKAVQIAQDEQREADSTEQHANLPAGRDPSGARSHGAWQTIFARQPVTRIRTWGRYFRQQPLTLALLLLVMAFGGALMWRWSIWSRPPGGTGEIAGQRQAGDGVPLAKQDADRGGRHLDKDLLLGVTPGPSVYAATITGDSRVQWTRSESSPNPRARLLAGQWLEFDSGLLEVTFWGGAVTLIEGPARFRVVDANSGLLMTGKLSADVPKFATGFKVTTPAGEIVDLGTRFAVAVGNEGTQARVFQGQIKALPADRADQGEKGFIHLTEGQAARLTADKAEIVPAAVDAGQFTTRLPDRFEGISLTDAAKRDAKVITPVSVSSNVPASHHPLTRMIDGSGLVGDGPVLTKVHKGNTSGSLLDDGTNWKAASHFLPIDLEFDLGQTFDVERLHLWSYTNPAQGELASARDARHVDLWLSKDGVEFKPAGSIELKRGELAAEPLQSYPLAGRARYVRLRLTSVYGGDSTEIGLGEVRFEGGPADSTSKGYEAKP